MLYPSIFLFYLVSDSPTTRISCTSPLSPTFFPLAHSLTPASCPYLSHISPLSHTHLLSSISHIFTIISHLSAISIFKLPTVFPTLYLCPTTTPLITTALVGWLVGCLTGFWCGRLIVVYREQNVKAMPMLHRLLIFRKGVCSQGYSHDTRCSFPFFFFPLPLSPISSLFIFCLVLPACLQCCISRFSHIQESTD